MISIRQSEKYQPIATKMVASNAPLKLRLYKVQYSGTQVHSKFEKNLKYHRQLRSGTVHALKYYVLNITISQCSRAVAFLNTGSQGKKRAKTKQLQPCIRNSFILKLTSKMVRFHFSSSYHTRTYIQPCSSFES